jgi:pyruvate kinase
MSFSKRTKIVCTIGPACNTDEKLLQLVEAGMNVCRLNFSHGTHEDHAAVIQRIAALREKTGEPLTVFQDLQGPKIRVGTLPPEGVELVAGEEVVFTAGAGEIPTKLPVTYPNLHQDVKPGQRLLLDDGLLSVTVKEVRGQDVVCTIVDGGKLTSHKGLNLPETQTSISAISEKDRSDIRFGVEHGVDWIALSFVRSPDDIRLLRSIIAEDEQALGIVPMSPIRILAKIEKPEAIERFDEILDVVDGIMVARGDLGIEMPAEKVPVLQKRIIAKCRVAAKPVIVATQMLDSMIRNPRPTRAEVSDIANAVIDHADATMLSGETASGAYPVESVQTMTATIRETEASLFDDVPLSVADRATHEQVMTNIAAVLGKAQNAKAIVVASLSGQAAKLVSRERPELPIYAATPDERVRRQLNLSWGVKPFFLPTCKTVSELVTQSLAYLVKQQAVVAGDEVVVCAGEPLGTSGMVNLVELRTV